MMATPPSPDRAIVDAESIARTYNTNIVAQRWGALILDLVLCIVLYVAVGVTFGGASLWPLALWAVGVFLYFILLEGRWGVTLGKLATKIRVVDRHGQTPGYRRAVVRMLLRVLEVNPLLAGGLPAGIIASVSKTKRRLGDVLAGTYVLYATDVRRLREKQSTPGVAEQEAGHPQPHRSEPCP
jgi:uncharacterized RDD family membrane protein YckC